MTVDPDYSPEYQDEYQRLWHEAAAERDAALVEVEQLRRERVEHIPDECAAHYRRVMKQRDDAEARYNATISQPVYLEKRELRGALEKIAAALSISTNETDIYVREIALAALEETL